MKHAFDCAFFNELFELMKKYEIKSITSGCNCDKNHYHIWINDEGRLEVIGMNFDLNDKTE